MYVCVRACVSVCVCVCVVLVSVESGDFPLWVGGVTTPKRYPVHSYTLDVCMYTGTYKDILPLLRIPFSRNPTLPWLRRKG